MSLSLALSLTPIMSGTIRGLAVLIESTLEHDAACHTLEAQCATLQAQVDAARAHVLQEKATQRQLRAEIVDFLRERSETRSASEYSVLLFFPRSSEAAYVTVHVLIGVLLHQIRRASLEPRTCPS